MVVGKERITHFGEGSSEEPDDPLFKAVKPSSL